MTEHRFVPTERPDARPPAGSKVEPTRQKRISEPHHQQKRRPVPPSLLLPGHSATTHRPRQEHEATQQGHLRQRLVPTERQCAGSVKARIASTTTAAPRPTSIRSSVVPQNDISECQRRAHTPNRVDQPRTFRTINSPFQQNAYLSVRSFMHDESWRSSNLSITLTPNLDHAGRPEQRTKHWQTARPRHATNARSRGAVEALSSLRAARTQRQAPTPPHGHRLKPPSSQLTKARPLDLPVWPRRHKPESSSAIFRSMALRRLDSKSLPSFIASPIRAGVPNRSFTQPSA
jgi:hypothetical protein